MNCDKCLYGLDGPDERLSVCRRCLEEEETNDLYNNYHADDDCYYDDDDLPF